MLGIRRTLAAITILASWSCGSTQPDATPEVADIIVNPSAPTMVLNAQLPLQALVRNAAGELVPDATVTWTVENAAIATVSTSGVVTAVGLGTTQVAASARGKSGIATVTVQRTPVASVVVLPSSVNAGIGGTTQLVAKAYDAGQNELSGRDMTWTSSNESVATVDRNGLVTAKAKGTATITATAEGKSGTSQFNISPGAVNKVTVTPSSISMVNGDKQHLSATAVDASGTVLTERTAIWSSDNTQVATAFGGEVSAVGRGSARITATVDGVSGSSAVTVANAPVASVSVAAASVVEGAKVQLSATVKDTRGVVVTDRVVTWSLPNNTFASINASTGEVTGVLAGSVTATATSEGKSGSATVTVTPAAVKSVTVAPAAPSVDVGKTQQFSATVIDVNNRTVTNRAVSWSSTNTQVATIDANSGLATVLTPGTATITATSGGVSGTTTLTAVPVVASVSAAPSSPSIAQNAGTTLTATVRDGAGNAIAGQTITWSTSDATIASLSATSGQSVTVTGGLAGLATITATSSGKSGTSTVTVTQGQVASVVVTFAANPIKPNAQTTATAVVYDANQRPLQGRTVSWFASGAATVTPATSVTSTGESSAATATVKGKNISTSQTATISATISGKSGSATLTVSP
ncbi:MAG: Ig domain-containing protein [Gemmatimonadaceae bacterium]